MRALPVLTLALLLAPVACRRPEPRPLPEARLRPREPAPRLSRLGWGIQAGAFSRPENAARLAERLREVGLEATHFPGKDGLFRVRFGDFPTRDGARVRAEALRREGLLEVFLVVPPEATPVGPLPEGIRRELVRTAESFLGVPYLWGGTSADTGFDCSGLTQAVYRLHGLQLPRSSREQFTAGEDIPIEDALPGDLLFFSARGRGRVDHVAVYVGDGRFIHAPGQGKSIRHDRLGGQGLALVGVRTYL